MVLKSFSELSLQLSVLVWILPVTSDGLGLCSLVSYDGHR